MSQRLFYRLSRFIVRSYAGLMLKPDVLRHAPLLDGPKLIVANHPSCSDPFFVAGLAAPEPTRILIYKEAFAVPVFGSILRRSRHIPVTLGAGRPAFDEALQALECGDSVMLFPEGWISPPQGGFNPPRTGAARLALAAGVPVVPIGVYLPRERNRVVSCMVDGRRTVGYWYLRGPYALTVGEPLRFTGDPEDRDIVADVSDRIMKRIVVLAYESEQRVVPSGSVAGKGREKTKRRMASM